MARGPKKLLTRLFGLTCAFLGSATASLESDACTEDAMLVFDGSGSMSEMGFNQLDEPRIFEARRAMQRSMPRIAAQRHVGLIIYGPADPEGCASVDLRFPPLPGAGPRILGEIDSLEPAGNTPLTSAVAEAAETLRATGPSGVIVLVTDGKETCGGTPCELAAEFVASSPWLTVHVVGFKVRGDHFAWNSTDLAGNAKGHTVARCLADQTGGDYFPTESAAELSDALELILGCPVVSGLAKLKTQS